MEMKVTQARLVSEYGEPAAARAGKRIGPTGPESE